MMHILWKLQLLLVSPSVRSNRDHFLQADFAGLIRLGEAERRQSCVYPRMVCGVIRADLLSRYTTKNWRTAIKSGPAHFPRSCSNRPIPASSNCMAPASAPRSTNAGAACWWIAHNANKARGIVRAAAYSANINDACVGMYPAGTRYCGRMIPTIEKPLATRTLIAVTTEASRIAFIVVIGSSRTAACKQAHRCHPGAEPKRWELSRDTQPQKHLAQIS